MKTTDNDQPNQDAMGELRETVESVISNPDRWRDWPDGAVDRIAKAAEAYAQRRLDEKTNKMTTAWLQHLADWLKGMRPAKPEDLTTSQWYGLVETIDAGIAQLQENSLKLNQTTEDKS